MNRENYDTEDDRSPEEALRAEIEHAHDSKRNPRTPAEVCAAIRGREHHHAVGLMLDALSEALQADMESGAAWMNDAASAEFKRKYPRFCTLFEVARRVDWEVPR